MMKEKNRVFPGRDLERVRQEMETLSGALPADSQETAPWVFPDHLLGLPVVIEKEPSKPDCFSGKAGWTASDVVFAATLTVVVLLSLVAAAAAIFLPHLLR